MTPLALAMEGPWQATWLPGEGEDLVIVFASVGHDLSRPPSPEFVRSASAGGRRALFISDTSRSWGTTPGLGAVLARSMVRLQTETPVSRILTLGTSMGAFLALRAAEILPVAAVLAIGPQYRPAAPDETRWRALTRDLPEDLTASLPEGTQVTLLHGMADDAAQALAFPQSRDVDHVLFPGLTHSELNAHLKAQGLMAGMIEAALAQDRRRLLRMLIAAGGERRVLPR